MTGATNDRRPPSLVTGATDDRRPPSLLTGAADDRRRPSLVTGAADDRLATGAGDVSVRILLQLSGALRKEAGRPSSRPQLAIWLCPCPK